MNWKNTSIIKKDIKNCFCVMLHVFTSHFMQASCASWVVIPAVVVTSGSSSWLVYNQNSPLTLHTSSWVQDVSHYACQQLWMDVALTEPRKIGKGDNYNKGFEPVMVTREKGGYKESKYTYNKKSSKMIQLY